MKPSQLWVALVATAALVGCGSATPAGEEDGGDDAGASSDGGGDDGALESGLDGGDEPAADAAPDGGASDGGEDGGEGDAEADAGPPMDSTYECELMGPTDAAAVEAFRKVVIVSTAYVGGVDELDATRVVVRYGTGPNHIIDWPDGYQVEVLDATGQLLESFSHGHPAVVLPEDGGCGWIAEPEGPTEIFDFVEPLAAELWVYDITGSIACDGGGHTGSGGLLLALDLRSCMDHFCAEAAVDGDPACP